MQSISNPMTRIISTVAAIIILCFILPSKAEPTEKEYEDYGTTEKKVDPTEVIEVVIQNKQTYFPDNEHNDNWEPVDKVYYDNLAFILPYQLFPNVSSRYFLEMENMTDFDCPRVYWPTCAKNQVTYANACVMHSLKETFQHFGPCLYFRRSKDSEKSEAVVVPKIWNTNASDTRENVKLNIIDFYKLFFVERIEN